MNFTKILNHVCVYVWVGGYQDMSADFHGGPKYGILLELESQMVVSHIMGVLGIKL